MGGGVRSREGAGVERARRAARLLRLNRPFVEKGLRSGGVDDVTLSLEERKSALRRRSGVSVEPGEPVGLRAVHEDAAAEVVEVERRNHRVSLACEGDGLLKVPSAGEHLGPDAPPSRL